MKDIKLLLLISIIVIALYTNFAQAKPIALKEDIKHQIITITYVKSLPFHLRENKITFSTTITPAKSNTVTVVNSQNKFFEMAILFNEKLQQFLDFFSFADDQKQINSSTSNSSEKTSNENCKSTNNI